MTPPTCPDCRSHNRVGVEVQGVYDGVLFWRCDDCPTDYHRFAPDHPLYRIAVKYMARGVVQGDG